MRGRPKIKIVLDKRNNKYCLACGIDYEDGKFLQCWARNRHIWSKNKNLVNKQLEGKG